VPAPDRFPFVNFHEAAPPVIAARDPVDGDAEAFSSHSLSPGALAASDPPRTRAPHGNAPK